LSVGFYVLSFISSGFLLTVFRTGGTIICLASFFYLHSSFFFFLIEGSFLLVMIKQRGLGKITERKAVKYDWYFVRRSIFGAIYRSFRLTNIIRGSMFHNQFYSLLGVNIGKNVYLDTFAIVDFDLLTIGDRAVIGHDAVVFCHALEGQTLRTAPVAIRPNVVLGSRSVTLPNADVDDELPSLSLALRNNWRLENGQLVKRPSKLAKGKTKEAKETKYEDTKVAAKTEEESLLSREIDTREREDDDLLDETGSSVSHLRQRQQESTVSEWTPSTVRMFNV